MQIKMSHKEILGLADKLAEMLQQLELPEKVDLINAVREKIHSVSPFRDNPVDFVRWVFNESVVANDYNPNKVAPPEMQLLEVSIINDGYTQPIVTFPREEETGDEVIEVVDGFHRSRVGKESKLVKQRVFGYLPTVAIRKEKQGKNERIASTIRHNRARGKHQVSAMSEIVIELKNRNWNNSRIARELGMDEDEILRLCQISGIENLFSDKDFSKAWVSAESIDEFEEMTDEVTEDDMNLLRIPNEADPDRIYHTFDKWEAVNYNFFGTAHKTMTKIQCEHAYKNLLTNEEDFRGALAHIIENWTYSCEHNLTNKAMNRIAWLGQAALAYRHQIPSIYCSGFQLLDKRQQDKANEIALEYLNEWLKKNGLPEVDMDAAIGGLDRQIDLY